VVFTVTVVVQRQGQNHINRRILKVNLSWSRTWAKLCQLIASLSVILSRFYVTKLKLEYLKFGFKWKKEWKIHRQFFSHHSNSAFSSSAQVCF